MVHVGCVCRLLAVGLLLVGGPAGIPGLAVPTGSTGPSSGVIRGSLPLPPARQHDGDVHVSASAGSDAAGAGTAAAPFASIAAALARVQRGQRVVVHSGVYPPVALCPKRHAGVSLVGAAAAGAGVDPIGAGPSIVSGGAVVPKAAFSVDAHNANIVHANLTALGLTATDLGHMVSGSAVDDCQHAKTGLFHEGERQFLARYPNLNRTSGYWAFAHATAGGPQALSVAKDKDPDAFAHIQKWASEEDAWLHGYWDHDWADSYGQVTGIHATDDNVTVTFKVDGASTVKAKARFYGVNLLSELDAPGEYYIAAATGMLSFYPATPLAQWQDDPVLSIAQVALNISGAHGTTVSGLEVAYAQGYGIYGDGVTDVLVTNCSVHGHGNTGVYLNGVGSGLSDSHVFDLGCKGAHVTGGDPYTLTPGNMFATGNTMHHHAQWKRTYQPGVYWGGVSNRYADNHVSQGPHNCFLGGGNEVPGVDCLFEGNTLDTCAFEAADTGAFYTCGQQGTAWFCRGNVLRNTTFVNIRNVEGTGVQGPSVQAIYLDDQMSGWDIYGNRFINCQTGTFVGGGRYNSVHDNYYQDCDTAHHFDNRGMGWQQSSCNCTCSTAGCRPFTTGCDPGGLQYVLKGAAGPEYLRQFPMLATADTDRPCVPVHNIVGGNSYCKCKAFTDASPADYTAWGSTLTNNTEVPCRF